MPLWDFRCDHCQQVFEDELCKHDEVLACPDCGDDLRRLVGGARMIGPTERRPVTFPGAGLAFASQKGIDMYKKAHPDAEFLSKSDPIYDKMRTRVRNEAERAATNLGYRDLDHMRHATPSEKRERREAVRKPTT